MSRPRRRAAIVSGGARGLGAEVGRGLARDGWRVMLLDACADDDALGYSLATPADLDGSLAACRDAAGTADNADARIVDVRDQPALDRAVEEAVTRFGGLDAAVAAAGVVAGGRPAWETHDDEWAVLLDVDLTGVWRLARAVVPALLSRSEPRSGRFVAVSSAGGMRGLPRLAGYCAAKHGVIGLVRSLAADLAGTGVTANVVCPGSMPTAMLQASAAMYGLDDVTDFAHHHLLGRLLDVAEVARVVQWLCREETGGMTGAVVAVDAGMTATAAYGHPVRPV